MAENDKRIESLEDEVKVLKGEVKRTLVDLRALLMREDSPLNEGALARRGAAPEPPAEEPPAKKEVVKEAVQQAIAAGPPAAPAPPPPPKPEPAPAAIPPLPTPPPAPPARPAFGATAGPGPGPAHFTTPPQGNPGPWPAQSPAPQDQHLAEQERMLAQQERMLAQQERGLAQQERSKVRDEEEDRPRKRSQRDNEDRDDGRQEEELEQPRRRQVGDRLPEAKEDYRGDRSREHNDAGSRVFEEYWELLDEATAQSAAADTAGGSPVDVNVIASLVYWVATAKQRLGDAKLKELLELYLESGHSRPGLEELLMHLHSVVDAVAPTPQGAAPGKLEWVDLMFQLHGILTGGLPIGRMPAVTLASRPPDLSGPVVATPEPRPGARNRAAPPPVVAVE